MEKLWKVEEEEKSIWKRGEKKGAVLRLKKDENEFDSKRFVEKFKAIFGSETST